MLEKIRSKFLLELAERSSLLDQAYQNLKTISPRTTALMDISKIAHKIAGTAGMLGFVELGNQAALAEELIRHYSLGGKVDENALRSNITKLIDLMRSAE
tara:strand:- start:8139 stop:8438 length:300 start_codon:yes stop_codon:yes gene_type:complete